MNDLKQEDIGQSKLKLLNSKIVSNKIDKIENAELKRYLNSISANEQKRYLYLLEKNEQLKKELLTVTEATEQFIQRER